MPHVENIYEFEPSITSWRGHQILCIRTGHYYNWYLSLQKAKVLLYHLEKVKEFVSTSGSAAYVFIQKKDHKCPVLLMDNTITTSKNFYNYQIGLHRAKLFLHWLPFVKMFAESEGKECIPSVIIHH